MTQLHTPEDRDLLRCAGYCQLLDEVKHSEDREPGRDFRTKLAWALERAHSYSRALGIPAYQVLDAWEADRDYWFMNYYQEANLPLLDGARVRVFDTRADLLAAIVTKEFRCPCCGGGSTNPYVCNSGDDMGLGEVCDWKVGGLFGDLGKGVHCYVLELMAGEQIFTPLAWEPELLKATGGAS